MGGVSAKRIVLLAMAAASLGWGQFATPAITSLSQTSVPAGSTAFTLTVLGTGLGASSVVSFNGLALVTTVSNVPGALDVVVPASLLVSPTQYNVQVTNPGPLVSNTVTFSVFAPSIASLSTTSLPAGSPACVLTLFGDNYLGTSQVTFNGTLLNTVQGDTATPTLDADVPASLLIAPGQYPVQVINPGGTVSNTVTFTVLAPGIPSLSTVAVLAGSLAFGLTATGVNYVSGSQISFRGTILATTFSINSTSPTPTETLTTTVPANLVATPGPVNVHIVNPGGSVSAAALFTVIAPLAIATTSLPSGTSGTSYSFTLTGIGGTPPYTWSASGLPSSLFVNPATGVISGVPQATGISLITVGLRDAANATATAQFQLVVSPPPVSIAPSSSLPSSGVVGVAYLGFVFANGGTKPYTFSLGSGGLPDGLTLSSGGMVSGTPKTPGQFSFSVVVRDATGATASQDFRITIQPAPLSITGGPTTTVPAGTPISISFTGTGGVGPYRFTLCGSLPPGTTFSNGVLSGTPTTPGTFTVCVTIADSTGAVFTKDFTLTVAPPAALSLSGSLPDGKVGVPYAGQISAAGGVGPYSYAGSGLPNDLSLSASGSISGTPGAAGQFSFTATATDSTGAKANATFRITIVPADLAIVTAALPDGVVGVAYSASLTATGGVPPYTWTVTGLPDGLTATAAGAIGGTPTKAGKFTVNVSVTDAAGASTGSRRVAYSVTIAPAPLAITTASAPNGTVGAAYSASFAASGGAAPLTFSASGLPAGLNMSAAGAVSGTPTAAGPATIVVTVKDAAGASTSKSFPVTIGLPSTPPLNLNIAGVSDTAGPLQQPRLQVTLGNTFPVDVAVTLTLSFAPDNGPDDPAIQFSGGGRTARITVPAGATNGATDVGVQTGSVAGLIAITAQLQASGLDVTPSPAPRRTIRVAAAAPVIVPGTLTAVRNSTGFTVTLTGYVTDRELTQAVFAFTAASGSNLQTTTLTVPADTLFAQYFSGSAATPFGSQFTYTQPFTVTGSTQAIVSVTVTLVNKIGQSAPVTATLN